MQSIKKTKKQELTATQKEVFEIIAPKISARTQITNLKEDVRTFGPSRKEGEFSVEITNGKSVKLIAFETDGEYQDGPVVNYADGYMRYRKVNNWSYILIENLTKGSDGSSRVVQTCYVRDKALALALRASVGLA